MILDDFFNSGFFGVVVGVRKPAGKGVSDGLSSIIEVNLDWLINCCVKRLECDDNSSGVGNCGKESLFFDLIDMFDLDLFEKVWMLGGRGGGGGGGVGINWTKSLFW